MVFKFEFWKKRKFIFVNRLENPILGQLRQNEEKYN